MCVRISKAGRPAPRRAVARDAMNQNGPAVVGLKRRGRPYRPTVRRTEEIQPDSESTTTRLSAQPVSAPDGVLRGVGVRASIKSNPRPPLRHDEAICIKPSFRQEQK